MGESIGKRDADVCSNRASETVRIEDAELKHRNLALRVNPEELCVNGFIRSNKRRRSNRRDRIFKRNALDVLPSPSVPLKYIQSKHPGDVVAPRLLRPAFEQVNPHRPTLRHKRAPEQSLGAARHQLDDRTGDLARVRNRRGGRGFGPPLRGRHATRQKSEEAERDESHRAISIVKLTLILPMDVACVAPVG